MKYRLTEDWLEYKKGHRFELSRYGGLIDVKKTYSVASPIEISLLLKTGILEEVREPTRTPRLGEALIRHLKEEEWLEEGFRYWFVGNDIEVWSTIYSDNPTDLKRNENNNAFRTESDAKEASEKIKTLLLSLKK